jgi:hypothetical protein
LSFICWTYRILYVDISFNKNIKFFLKNYPISYVEKYGTGLQTSISYVEDRQQADCGTSLENIVCNGHNFQIMALILMGTTGRPADSEPWGLLLALCASSAEHASWPPRGVCVMLFWRNKVVPSWSHFTVGITIFIWLRKLVLIGFIENHENRKNGQILI